MIKPKYTTKDNQVILDIYKTFSPINKGTGGLTSRPARDTNKAVEQFNDVFRSCYHIFHS